MNKHIENCCEKPALKRPCRCGGKKFIEPKMKVTNCYPKHCIKRECCGCRCCCDCKQPCCDKHPCDCARD